MLKCVLQRLLGAIAFFSGICLPAMAVAQGAWTPANADLSYPRTLLKSAEIPAVIHWIETNPEMYGFYDELYHDTWGWVPTVLVSDGDRRHAAHMAKNCAFAYLLDRKPIGPSALDTLTTLEATTLRDKAIQLLNIVNTAVEAYPDFENYLWRSNEITDNMIAYDLLKGAGVPDSLLTLARRNLHVYATNFHTQIAFNLFGLGLTRDSVCLINGQGR